MPTNCTGSAIPETARGLADSQETANEWRFLALHLQESSPALSLYCVATQYSHRPDGTTGSGTEAAEYHE
jgi:hypothetical protein